MELLAARAVYQEAVLSLGCRRSAGARPGDRFAGRGDEGAYQGTNLEYGMVYVIFKIEHVIFHGADPEAGCRSFFQQSSSARRTASEPWRLGKQRSSGLSSFGCFGGYCPGETL